MQGMGVLGEQKPFVWEKCHGALSPKGMWLAKVLGKVARVWLPQ